MSFWINLKNNIKRYFFFGLATFIPAYITIIIVIKIIRFFDGIIAQLISVFKLSENFKILSFPFVGAVISFIFLIAVGFFSRQFFGKKVMAIIDKIFTVIPISRPVYSAIKKMTETFIDDDKSKFKRVVLVPFPHQEVYAIGFLTNRAPTITEGVNHYYVYVPTAINPTAGFLINVREDQIIESDMKVDEAFSLILSGGMLGKSENKS
ncbi:MAG: DUF502 domain-containing protein [Proteobacteria bacterium]|nr:DUF502 domain-containing protein [Pseudomonadota bacterium]